MKSSANLIEIFTSIQGEGLFIGNRQLFLRFAGCNLKCSYCDTKDSWEIPSKFNFEQIPTKRDFIKISNPIETTNLSELLEKHLKNNIHSVSLTGGEPLLHAEFLIEILPILKSKNHKIFLETNGLLPDNLEKIIKWIDIISMDIKIPSICEHEIDFKNIEKFTGIAYRLQRARENFYVKVVVNESLSTDEFIKSVSIISNISSEIPLVIQPEYTTLKTLSIDELFDLQTEALKYLKKVLIIPQIHKLMGLK